MEAVRAVFMCVCVCVGVWGGVSGKGTADEKEERMDDVLRF